jgi:hypothetical protein
MKNEEEKEKKESIDNIKEKEENIENIKEIKKIKVKLYPFPILKNLEQVKIAIKIMNPLLKNEFYEKEVDGDIYFN